MNLLRINQVEASDGSAIIILASECSDDKRETMPAELLERAKELSRKQGYVSVSYLQRNLPIGYWRAGQFVEQLRAEGFCSVDVAGSRFSITPNLAERF